MSKNMTCSVCGYPNANQPEICENCGASLNDGTNEEVEVQMDSVKVEQHKEVKSTIASPQAATQKPQVPKSKKKGPPKGGPATAAPAKRALQSEFLIRDGMLRIQMKTWQFFGFSFIGIAIIVLVILYLVDSGTPGTVPVQNPTQQMAPQGPSITDIEKAQEQVAANPNNPDAILALSHLQHDSNMFDQAVLNYRRYLEIIPDNPDARVDLGICLHALGQNDLAIAEMKTVVAKNPGHQLGHFNLGIVHLAIGDTSAAKIWLQRTIELNAANQIGQRAATLISGF